MPEPYYSSPCGRAVLYHGDAHEIVPELGRFDLMLTDPPYGIAAAWKGGTSHGWASAREQTPERNAWDQDAPPLDRLLAAAGESIVWGGNHFPDLPPSRGWLVWNKPERGFTLSEAELAWTSRDTVVRVFDWRRSDPGRTHPTQKPEKVMEWCLTLRPKAATVIDPFMGSGTTGVACARLDRRFVGIDLSEEYCETAARRIDAALAQTSLFPATP